MSDPATKPALKTILIVEDERDIRDLIRYHLERESFAVVEAGVGVDVHAPGSHCFVLS